jgi:valyl-tRNA synthetase
MNIDNLPTTYSPQDIEEGWYQIWNKGNYFAAEKNSTKQPYCIIMPPPNVTGKLHMGHALDVTTQDVLTRFKRMKGFNTLWLPCLDHAGIATQSVVEKLLAQKNINRHDLGREKFIEVVTVTT